VAAWTAARGSDGQRSWTSPGKVHAAGGQRKTARCDALAGRDPKNGSVNFDGRVRSACPQTG
jgi:hypothetical protein